MTAKLSDMTKNFDMESFSTAKKNITSHAPTRTIISFRY